MTDRPPNWSRVREVFDEVIECPCEERDRLLAQRCSDDPDLLVQVKRLIAAHDRAEGFLGGDDGSAPTAAAGAPPAEREGAVIGRYRLLERIGQGGFGEVYMARQQEPVRRMVALKIIKLGMDSRQVIARFEAERQALAMMDHPNIARVFDAGATDSGRPYFVMELVKGVPITRYCDTERLDTRQRLALFADVCKAVQHAHQKSIIHRDIKPSNILVTLHDGRPVPKVIDFGIAKAVDRELTERTLFTEFRQFIGTPEYMSPEQAEMSGLDIDTRSDIYSLGVLLYELLTGTTPFAASKLNSAPINEIQRIIREEEPRRPSQHLGTLRNDGDSAVEPSAAKPGATTTLNEVCRVRRTDPASLRQLLRGDLDWIVMKALEKDRTRRYETAAALAEDIRRHLDDEPVLAGPPSTVYRLGKFTRRNRGLVLAASFVAMAMLLGMAGTTGGLIWALRERDRAEAGEVLARQREQEALRQTAIAEAVNAFLNEDLLAAVAPSAEAGRGRDVRMRDVLDEASIRLDHAAADGGRFADQPLVEAAIRLTVGDTYRQLGEYKPALKHLERAAELRESTLGPDDPETLKAISELAQAFLDAGRLADAEQILLRAVDSARAVLGEEHPVTVTAMARLALLYRFQHRIEESLVLHQAVVEKRERILGPAHGDTLVALNNLAIVHAIRGEMDLAVPLFERAYEAAVSELGERHTRSLAMLDNLAIVRRREGRLDEARRLHEHSLAIKTEVYGHDHPSTLKTLNGMAIILERAGDYDGAIRTYRRKLEIQRERLGNLHPDVALTLQNLGVASYREGRLEDAEASYREAISIYDATHGPDHYQPIRVRSFLVNALLVRGEPVAAELAAREALPLAQSALGEAHPETLVITQNLGASLRDQGRHEEAEPFYETSVRLAEAGPDPRYAAYLTNYGDLLRELRRYKLAERTLLRVESLYEQNPGDSDWQGLALRMVALYEAWGEQSQNADITARAARWRAMLPHD